MKTIYKKDTKGKIRYLKIWTDGADLVQESGVESGNPIIHRKTCKGKNIGKTNETTPEEQAIKEMDSKVEDKLSQGYFTSKEDLENTRVILPMLAKKFQDEIKKIAWNDGNTYLQPKLDGMRCISIIKRKSVEMISRDGKDIMTTSNGSVEHIQEELFKISLTLPEKHEIILDGELYAHGKSFQENMKLIKKYRDGEDGTLNICYHIYDLVSDSSFQSRFKILQKYLDSAEEENPFIYLNRVLTYPVESTDQSGAMNEIYNYHSMFLSLGYEGTIIRHGNEGYKIKGRSSSLLKYKDFKDIAAKIIDILPADARPEWGVPVCEWQGKRFRAGTKLSHEDRKDLLLNKNSYIGKTAEIRYFEETDDGLPRFPVFVGIRLDK